MQKSSLNRRRPQSSPAQIFSGRGSVQVLVGALAIAAIVLALTTLRPGDSTQESRTAAPAAKATIVEAGLAPAPVPTAARSNPTPSATSAPAKAASERTHTVASGDTLSTIAKQYYSDASKWTKVFEANRDQLPDANSLKLGQKLKIPE